MFSNFLYATYRVATVMESQGILNTWFLIFYLSFMETINIYIWEDFCRCFRLHKQSLSKIPRHSTALLLVFNKYACMDMVISCCFAVLVFLSVLDSENRKLSDSLKRQHDRKNL